MKENKECQTCGAKTVQYKHGLNKALVSAIRRIPVQERAFHVTELGLTHNQAANFQKLRYWDIIANVEGPDGSIKNGWWKLTMLGWSFVRGQVQIPRQVWTYRGTRTKYDGELIFWNEAEAEYRKRPEYIADAKSI